MKIYSDKLTRDDLIRSLPQGMYLDEVTPIRRPRIREKGFKISTSGNTNHFKNTGVYGASNVYAASRDQHGWFFAALYDLDPNMVVVGDTRYNDSKDFHEKTKGKYQEIAA